MRPLIAGATEAVRAALTSYIPIALVVLMAWATAGSASGVLTDALRGGIWIWLGVHHITFTLALPPSGLPGSLSFIPLGALLFPIIIFRGSLRRLRSELQGVQLRQSIFSLGISYIFILIALSVVSKTISISPRWYVAPLSMVVLLGIASLTQLQHIAKANNYFNQVSRILLLVLGMLLGISLIFFSASLALHFSVLKDLITVLQPGILGGILLLILVIATIPNMAVSALAYLLGPGFAIGSGTLINPAVHRIGEIPAFPLLAAVPTNTNKFLFIGVLLGVGAGFMIALLMQKTERADDLLAMPILIVTSAVVLAIINYFSNGTLLGERLSDIGPSLWIFPLIYLLEAGIGAGIYFGITKITKITKLQSKNNE
ncbi:MAG: DUF6350 family protein [Actinobacteria bacterium]|nr:DUF6350 family protein [Actinomycetota bacterium]